MTEERETVRWILRQIEAMGLTVRGATVQDGELTVRLGVPRPRS